MSAYVYSTATNSITYVEYEKNASNELAIAKKWPDGTPMRVTIKGGHGVATVLHCITPRGVITQIKDHEMEWLLTNPSFKKHIAKGYMTYDKKKVNPEKKARDMENKDGSSPITPSDYVQSEHSTPGNIIYKMKERKTG